MWRQRISEIDTEAQVIRDAIKRINRLASRVPSVAEESA